MKVYEIGDTVQVFDYKADARCTFGLRRVPAGTGTVWRPNHVDRYGREVCEVITESSNYVATIPVCVLGFISHFQSEGYKQ